MKKKLRSYHRSSSNMKTSDRKSRHPTRIHTHLRSRDISIVVGSLMLMRVGALVPVLPLLIKRVKIESTTSRMNGRVSLGTSQVRWKVDSVWGV